MAENATTTRRAATLVATFTLPDGAFTSIRGAFLAFAAEQGLTLIPCGWAPDADSILDYTPDADSISIMDLNPAPNE